MPTNRLRYEGGVLLISPDEEDHDLLREILTARDFTLYRAHTPEEAQAILRDKPVAAIVADSRGWKDLLEQMWSMEFPLLLIVADRLADERLWAEVLNLGGYDLLTKPFDAKEVLTVLSLACRREEGALAGLSLRLHGSTEGQPAVVDTAAGSPVMITNARSQTAR